MHSLNHVEVWIWAFRKGCNVSIVAVAARCLLCGAQIHRWYETGSTFRSSTALHAVGEATVELRRRVRYAAPSLRDYSS